LVALLVGTLAFASVANATSITGLAIFNDPSIENLVSDDSVETIVKGTNPITGLPNVGLGLEVGDTVQGIFNINSMTTAFTNVEPVGTNGNNELTGIFSTLVLDRIPTANGYTYIFGPDPAWSAAPADLLGKAMVIFYEDTTPDFTKTGGPASVDITNATNGNYFWALGMMGTMDTQTWVTDLGEAWKTADNTQDPPIPGVDIGSATFALNRIGSGLISGAGDKWILDKRTSPFDANQGVDVTGSTEFWANITTAPPGFTVPAWPIGDETNFFVNPLRVIPLPAAAWMGLAMLGALGVGRRLRRRS
jgi:hypothetical protein